MKCQISGSSQSHSALTLNYIKAFDLVVDVKSHMPQYHPMANEAHVRIDEGIKRPQKRKMRQDARRSPISKQVIPWQQHDPEKRKAIILEAPERILRGETTTEIAHSYEIPPSTLRAWLVGNPDAELARGAMLAQELMAKIEAIDASQDALSLAQAREGFKAWSWIAERREHRLYGAKQEVTVTNEVTIEAVLDGQACALLAKLVRPSVVIDAHCSAITPDLPSVSDDS